MNHWFKSNWYKLVTILTLFGFILTPVSTLAQSSGNEPAYIDPKVIQQIDDQGKTTFWVILKAQADLSLAEKITDWNERGKYVYETLTRTAEQTQSGLISLLTKNNATFKSFWVINAIQASGDRALLDEISIQPEVDKILADQVFTIPEPLPGTDEPKVDVVEWNIDRIRAPLVWSTFGAFGDGIVVANIDTGVDFTHSALVNQYRGNLGGGTFDHNYNWFDPSNICGNPSLAPCDNNGHGTHTMGTMVGDDGNPGVNQIGVAPHARWVAAKGCETNSCSTSALLASAQWVLAPTDLNGQNPRADLRPNIVNNSWSGGGGDPWYQAMVQAWRASGIFPAFANSNAGPSCGSSGSPGDYPESYSAGAFDINNAIASFSSRGPSAFGVIKPNVAAPGVSVRSSVPGNGYASFSGTSMASPHVAGTVALLWSAAPAIIGDISATEALLDQTAIDTSDLQCGGTAADNNVFGEGRLDAFAAVDLAPRGPTGTLQGTVTDSGTNAPIAGATVTAVGPTTRTTLTDANGFYSFLLPVGAYDVTASAFGYASQTVTGVTVTDGGTTIQDFALVAAPSHMVSGTVFDNFQTPVANATVTILNTPIPPATTDANGFYSFASVPEGTYDVQAAAGLCNDPQTQTLVVDGDEVLDFSLPLRMDAFGYYCSVVTPAFIDANTVIPLSGDDSFTQISLPFSFSFYGQTYNSAFVATNGYLNFLAGNSTFSNSGIPSTGAPNGAIYPFWDDMYVDASSSVRTELLGASPNQQFVIEWLNVRFFGDTTRRLDFEVILHENGQILTQYRNIAADGREQGNSATLGIENESGTVAFQYSFNQAVVASPDFAVLYRLPPSGFVEGVVTDYNDGLPLAGATISAMQGGSLFRQTTSDAAGFYRMQLPLGSYDIEAGATNYTTASAPVVLDVEGEVVTQDFALMTAKGVVAPSSFQFVVPVGQTRTQNLLLSNLGSADMTWQIQETGGGAMSVGSTQNLPKNPDYDPNSMTTEGLYAGGTPDGWSPSAPGDVLASWAPTGLSLAWGVGFNGNVWLSDVPTANNNHEFSTAGAPTGVMWHAGWAGSWPGDMAFDAGRNLMCQVNVGGDNGIYCWDPATGNVVDSITGAFPWTSISQRGLAYNSSDDTFYIGGWNEGILYHVKGLSYPDRGAVISQCLPPDGNISGLAWNPAFNVVWAATNSPTDTIYELDPATCTVLGTLPHPSPGFNGAGLEMDTAGNLWMISQSPNTVYLIDSGVPAFVDVPWLSESPTSGTLTPGAEQQIAVSVDTTGLTPGVYNATIFVTTNSGRIPTLQVPVSLIVPAYYQAVNAGGSGYTDSLGDFWSADQRYSAGSWGFTNANSRSAATKRAINGTIDDTLFQSLRQNATEYRFDGLPNGVYQITLDFAEIMNRMPGTRIFDVIIEGNIVLPSHDVAAEVGSFTADVHTFYVLVTDGQLNIRFVLQKGYAQPIINAIQVIHRPDR